MSVRAERERLEKLLESETGLERYTGSNWYQLTAEEAFVFELKLEDMPRLAEVYEVYSGAVDISTGISKERMESLQQELDWLSKGTIKIGEWIRFAALFEISSRQAVAFFRKHEFWEVREGLVSYADEE